MAENDSTLHLKLVRQFEDCLTHPAWTDFLKNAQSDFEYYEGVQFTSAEKAEIEDRGQPVIVENEIKPIIDRIEGQYTQTKTRIGFRGRNFPQDEDLGNVLSDLVLYVQQQNDFEYEEKDQFKDGIKSGFGVLEVAIDESGLYPKIILKHEDCLNIFPDPYSKRYDWNEDANFINRTRWVKLDNARVKFPNKVDILNSSINTDIVTSSIVSFKKENYFDGQTQRLRLIETWYKDEETRKFVSTPQGPEDVTDLPTKTLKKIKKQNPDVIITEKPVTVMKMAVWCLGGILSVSDSPYQHNMFPFVPFYVDRKKTGEPVGIIRALKDPQSEINKRRSKALHLLSTNQAIYEEGAVRDKNEIRAEMARPDGLIERRKGYEFEVNKNIDLAETQMSLLEESKMAIKRIAGMDMGVRQEVRSNQQLQRKQAMEDIVIVPVFDNLRRTRKITARLIYELIKQYFDEEMVFNITDNMQATKLVTATQDHMAKIKESNFDIVAEELPETTTIQNEQFTMIIEMLRSMPLPPTMAMPLSKLAITMSQLRNKKEIMAMIEEMGQPPPDQPKISLAMQWSELMPEEKAKIAEIMGFPDLAQWELQEGLEPSQLIKAKEGITKTQIKVQGDIEKARTSKDDPEIELAKAEMDMELEQEKHGMKMQHEHEKHQMKMSQQGEQHRMKTEQAGVDHTQKVISNAEMMQQKRQMMKEQVRVKGNTNTTRRNK